MEKEKDVICVFDKKDCFANKCGYCDLLTNTNFKGKPCPFYKTEKEYKEDKKKYATK